MAKSNKEGNKISNYIHTLRGLPSEILGSFQDRYRKASTVEKYAFGTSVLVHIAALFYLVNYNERQVGNIVDYKKPSQEQIQITEVPTKIIGMPPVAQKNALLTKSGNDSEYVVGDLVYKVIDDMETDISKLTEIIAPLTKAQQGLAEDMKELDNIVNEFKKLQDEERTTMIQIRSEYVNKIFSSYDKELVEDYLEGTEDISQLRKKFLDGASNDGRLVGKETDYVTRNFLIAGLELLRGDIITDLKNFTKEVKIKEFRDAYQKVFYSEISQVTGIRLKRPDSRELLTAVQSIDMLTLRNPGFADKFIEKNYTTITLIYAEQGKLYRELTAKNK